MNKNIFVKILILVLSVILLWLLFFWGPVTKQIEPKHETLALSKAPKGGNFSVQALNKKLSLEGLKGKVVLLYFGYTQCPDICPTSLSLMSEAFKQLNKTELEKVQGLFISVDPDRDTPKKQADYTHYFHPKIIGATSNKQALDKIVKQYGASYRIVKSESAMGYMVDHSSATYLIDQTGQLRKILKHGTSPDKIVAAVRALLER